MQAAEDFWTYFNIIKKSLWLTLLLFLVTEGVILAVTFTAEEVYRATVRLQVLATDPSEVSLFTEYRTTTTYSEIQQAQNDFMRVLKSGSVAWATIRDLNLGIGAVDLLEGLSTAVEADIVRVTVESDDPGRAEAIATNQVNNALKEYRVTKATPSRILLDFVSDLLASEEQKMLDAERSLLEFKQRYNLDSISQETYALQDVLRNLKLERDRALIERERADIFANIYRAEQKEAIKQAESALGPRASAEATASGESTQVESSSTADVVAPSTAEFYRDLARQHEATAIGYEAKRDGYARSLEIYDQMIDERTKELQDLIQLYSEYNKLERDLSRARNNYTFLWDKENEALLKKSQAERLGYIQITEPARKPDEPVPSKLIQLLLVGGAVSVLTGFVLSFLIEFLSSLKPPKQRVR